MKLTYQKESVDEVIRDIQSLLLPHYVETAPHQDKVALDPIYSNYYDLEELGYLCIITARDKFNKLVGYAIYVMNEHMHCSNHIVANNDMSYILPKYRGKGMAVKMFQKAEECLRALGCHQIIIGMKIDSTFRSTMEGEGFEPHELLYTKYIGD
jgi:GNAT superfamily N-acetyltransferase